MIMLTDRFASSLSSAIHDTGSGRGSLRGERDRDEEWENKENWQIFAAEEAGCLELNDKVKIGLDSRQI
ncbi:hypothetical protein SRHO_G00052460 [Serrasalmus rhombeus]